MMLFKKKPKYISYSDFDFLIKYSEELEKITKENYPLNGSDISNKLNAALIEARLSTIQSYKFAFEQLKEEWLKRETPLYWHFKQIIKKIRNYGI